MKTLRSVLFFTATLLLYLGVPLLGWGLGDLVGFFSVAPRMGYGIAVCLFSLAVGIQAFGSTEGIRGGKGEATKFVFRQRVVRIVLVLFLYLALIMIPYFERHQVAVLSIPPFILWLGVILSAIGFGLIFLSGLALGRQYSADVTIQKDHQLVTYGIYRYLRHPRYIGIIALAAGLSLVFRSGIGLIACPIIVAALIFRIRDEEIAMHKEFGSAWEAYCRASWRLIPYLY